MANTIGIHTIELRSGASGQEFEQFMLAQVFPATADEPGSVTRAGKSTISSQHLVRDDGNQQKYLWIVKSSGVFNTNLFSTVFNNMLNDVREKLNGFGSISSSSVLGVLSSYDSGPRDLEGRPTGKPIIGTDV